MSRTFVHPLVSSVSSVARVFAESCLRLDPFRTPAPASGRPGSSSRCRPLLHRRHPQTPRPGACAREIRLTPPQPRRFSQDSRLPAGCSSGSVSGRIKAVLSLYPRKSGSRVFLSPAQLSLTPLSRSLQPHPVRNATQDIQDTMRARYKGPGGTGVVSLEDDATVGQLFDAIKTQAGIADFTLKFGWPLQTLSLEQRDANARDLGLNGQSFTIEPAPSQTQTPAASAPPPPPPTRPSEASVPFSKKPRLDSAADPTPSDISIPWPERESTLLLRVMPDDNSCLFTAFGGAIPGKQMEAKELRKMIADYIRQHPDDYSEAVLNMPVDKYCRTIQDPDRWGGAIELGIFSDLFDLEILAFDVKSQNPLKFGENKDSRCILVYSGIHYDRIACSPSEPPYTHSDLPPELDRTNWSTSDDAVLEKTRDLIRKLHEMHYFTDTVEFLLRCTIAGCDWIGNGEKEANRHAKQTGHMGFDEIKDEPHGAAGSAAGTAATGDNALRKCNAPGCEWLGTSTLEARMHTSDTGHTSMSEIPDF